MKSSYNIFYRVAIFLRNLIRPISFRSSGEYWDQRYKIGGTSGSGSYGHFSEFKAEVLNQFVVSNDIHLVLDFGCGDGSQLTLANYPKYVGFDVSKRAIQMCANRFLNDKTKSFFLYDPECFVDNGNTFQGDLAISLDVIYHLVEDKVYEKYMKHLFASSSRYVIIYSCDLDKAPMRVTSHVKPRCFTKFVNKNFPEWNLQQVIANRFPFDLKTRTGSWSDFYIYKKGTANNF